MSQKTKVVQFTKGRLLPVTRDGLDLELVYSMVDNDLIGEPEEASQTQIGRIVVGASRTLQVVWGLSDEDLGKVLYEYGKRRIKDKVLEGTITGHEELQLTTANVPEECPFDPNRIKVLLNVPFEFPVDIESFAVTGEFPGLAGDIIDLLDNINALFH